MRFSPFLRFATVAVVSLLLSSCATLSGNGVGRVKNYTVESPRLPESFDGVRIAFISDLHYPSKFTPKRLARLVRKLNEIGAGIVAFGGDYVPSSQYVSSLFSSFLPIKTAYGKYAVLGNHDVALRDTLRSETARCGIRLLADEEHYISNGTDSLRVVGVRNSFECGPVGDRLATCDDLFTILLSHTPDFAQKCGVECDVVLSGHTHGGQVSLFGIYTPVRNTKYGARFLRGKNHTDNGTPVITTNGVGTSRRKVRFCVPSEIVVITLKRK